MMRCRPNPFGSRANPGHRAGWTIMHMLAIMGLLGFFLLAASRLFMMTHRTIAKSQKAVTMIHQSQHMISQFRADVWSAHEMKIQDDGSVILTWADEQVVRWSFADAIIQRATAVDGERAKQWSLDLESVAFTVEGPTLTVQLAHSTSTGMTTSEAAGELRLSSQVLLARAMQPQGGER